jgi:hypothetical protein
LRTTQSLPATAGPIPTQPMPTMTRAQQVEQALAVLDARRAQQQKAAGPSLLDAPIGPQGMQP